MTHDDNHVSGAGSLREQYQHERARARCEPIVSLVTRKRRYWAEVHDAVVPLSFIVLVGLALCLAAVKLVGVSWIVAAFVCAAMMAPPIWMFWPDYPTEYDVESDRKLRRSAGLPDDVELD